VRSDRGALRRQLIVLHRKVRGRVELTNSDRLFFIQLFPSILKAITTFLSRLPNSRLSGKRTGNFVNSRGRRPFARRKITDVADD
jgi:hypothetical protein